MEKKELFREIEKNFLYVPLFFKHYFQPPRKIFEEKNLSHWDMHLLMFLLDNGRSTMTEIANMMLTPKSNVTAIINRLIKEEWVERISDPSDRRVIYIDITRNGKAVLKKGREEILASFRKMTENHPEEWLRQVNEIFEKFHELLDSDPRYQEMKKKKGKDA